MTASNSNDLKVKNDMNKKIIAVLLAALCLVSCGSKADESSEAAETAETTTVTTTETTTAATAAETTTAKKSKKKKTTTAEEETPAEDTAAETVSVEEAIETAMNDPEFKELVVGYKDLAKQQDKPWSSSMIKVLGYAGSGFNFWVDSELWTTVQDNQQVVQLERDDQLRSCGMLVLRTPVRDIPGDDTESVIEYISSDIKEHIAEKNLTVMGETTLQTTYGGNNAVRTEYAVADKGSSYPVSVFGTAGIAGNGKLYIISYSYAAYMPYEDTGFDDVFDTFKIVAV